MSEVAYKIGILGAGRIARQMARTLNQMDTAQAWAVGARDCGRAEEFAREFQIPRAYGSYQELLGDPEVAMVYIATPHSHHMEQAVACLEAGKHVLCEKAFTRTGEEATRVLALAKERGLLVAEAIWTRYMPMAQTLRDLCREERVGRIWGLSANLGYPVIQQERIRSPQLAGGALLDVGIYPLTFASIVFGDDIQDIATSAAFGPSGVDVQNSVILTYRDGRTATLYSTVLASTDRTGVLYGERGYAVVENINNFQSVRVFDQDHRLVEQIDRPPQLTGYEYEVQAAMDAARRGEIECPQMPHARIQGMMELMDQIRHRWGFWYPGERENGQERKA